MKLLAIGGMPDHVHCLLALPSTLALAKAMDLLVLAQVKNLS